MISYDKLRTALLQRIGFRQTLNTGSAQTIAEDLVVSESGLLVNSLNEQFLTNDNIFHSIRFFDGMDLPVFALTDTYKKDQAVQIAANGLMNVYVSRTDSNIGNDPLTSPDAWDSSLSYQLRQYRDSAINEMINDALTKKELAHSTKRLLNSSPLFNERAVSRVQDRSQDRFVGVEIIPAARNNIQLQINKLGFRSTVAQDIELHLFHSSSNTALKTFTVSITEANNFQWSDKLDLVLNFIDDSHNIGGRFYLGYYEEDLTGDLYNWQQPSWWNNLNSNAGTGCQTCGGSNVNLDFQLYSATRSFFAIRAIAINKQFITGKTLPNIGENFNNISYTDRTPFNLRSSAFCDPTIPMIETVSMFDKALQARLATTILTDLKNSNRVGNVPENNERKLDMILHGAFSNGIEVQQGLNSKYNEYLKQIEIDFAELDPLCWRNNNMIRNGVN